MRVVAEQVREHFHRPVGNAELVLIDVNPYRLHAFWTVDPEAMAAARRTLGKAGDDAPMVIRLYRADDGGESAVPAEIVSDVRVQGFQSQTYADMLGDARRYIGELGLRSDDGRLVPLARSRVVELPRAALPQRSEFTTVSIAIEPTAEPNVEPAAAPVAEPNPETAADPIAEGAAELFEAFAPVAAPVPPVAAIGGEQGRPAALALENILPVSSYLLGREGVELEFSAEVHVFGRARPGTELRLFGQPVRLRPDGSFLIRRILPNDAHLLTALLAGRDPSEGSGQH